MSGSLGDWVGYIPDQSEHRDISGPQRARLRIIPPDGDAFFVYGEYDDGNGMWIITGVSRDLSTY